jgi:hypothetical protein
MIFNTIINFFKKDPKLTIIIVLAVLFAGQIIYNNYKDAAVQDELRMQRNRIALLSDVIKKDSATYSRLALEYTNVKDINKFLQKENKNLADKLKNAHSVTIVNVVGDTSKFNSQNLAIGDSIYQQVDTTVTPERIKVEFKFTDQMYSIQGWTKTNKPEAKVKVNINPFSVAIINNELEDGSYNTTVSFYDKNKKQLPFSVTDIKSAVIRQPDRSEKKNIFMFGLGADITLRQFAPGAVIYWNTNLIKVSYLLYNENLNLQGLEKIQIGYYKLF